jgi:hypothetical protein
MELENIFFKKCNTSKDEYFKYLNDAEELTEDFKYRHFDNHAKSLLGCYRWKGVYQHRDYLKNILESSNSIDLGGAASPIGNSIVVDNLKFDYNNNPVKYNTIESVDFDVNFIFSSHTLEHVFDIKGILLSMSRKLNESGSIFLHLPAYTCKRWLPGIHSHLDFGDHQWSFSLSSDKNAPSTDRNIVIDKLVKNYFNNIKSFYTGDNSIIVMADK